jgi:hypothetical protein
MILFQVNMGSLPSFYHTPVWYCHSFFKEASFFRNKAIFSGSYENSGRVLRGASWSWPRHIDISGETEVVDHLPNPTVITRPAKIADVSWISERGGVMQRRFDFFRWVKLQAGG